MLFIAVIFSFSGILSPDFQIIDLEKPIAIDTKVKKDSEIKLTIEEWYLFAGAVFSK
ncbi:MAG: hypothetical protein J5597_04365 [Spirochaetaceae bacterium]|nr:hypothetical protein [Spirochaetaceae bacterium]